MFWMFSSSLNGFLVGPLSPDQLTVSNVSHNSLGLHWTINASYHFDEFIIEYSENDSPDIITTIHIDDDTTMRYDIHNLTSGTGYTFNVYSAINGTRSETPAPLSVFTSKYSLCQIQLWFYFPRELLCLSTYSESIIM